jgi:hypothetical protein
MAKIPLAGLDAIPGFTTPPAFRDNGARPAPGPPAPGTP